MSTPEERAETRDELNQLIAVNMGISFAKAALEDGGLSIEVALNGVVAMFDFGLVLAVRHPELAAIIRLAAREHDEAKGAPVSTDEAVDAVVEHLK